MIETKEVEVQDAGSLFVPTYKRSGAPMERGLGMYLYDTEGKEYLDFGSGIAVNALGHSHPLLLEALHNQAARLIHASNLYYTTPQIELASRLIKNSFGEKVFLCNSGTEANEAAIKFARKWASRTSQDKYHVLSFSEGFHGRTYGALSATAQRKFHEGFGPMPQGFHYSQFNDLDKTEEILNSFDFAAIIIEPLQGEGGINSADTDFLKFLRQYADKNSVALIFDEIQCGTGRTGTLWNYEQHGVIPDLMTVAKPIGGGLPLGAVVCSERISSVISPGDHGTTFGGNPLACALGTQILDIVSDPVFLKRVRCSGDYLKKRLSSLKSEFSSIENVRGEGLLLGVRFKDDPLQIITLCKDQGLLLIKAGLNTVRFMPPLIVGMDHIDKAVDIFSDVLKLMKK
ncbi:MAG: aspartate aminotransferase family protein [Chitinispirillaceae bacterium]